MDIKEFAEIIKERLEERTGLEVRVQQVNKNNGVVLHHLFFKQKVDNMVIKERLSNVELKYGRIYYSIRYEVDRR